MDKDTLDFFDKFIQIGFGDNLSQERLKKEYFELVRERIIHVMLPK